MAGLNREEIIVALEGFTASKLSRWWGNHEAGELAEVVGLQPLIDQQMRDLGALLLRLGLESLGDPWGCDPPAWKAWGHRLFVTAYDVMVLAGYNPYHNRALPAAPQTFADAPDLWRHAHSMACARE